MSQEQESDLESHASEQEVPWLQGTLPSDPSELPESPYVAAPTAGPETEPIHKPAIVSAANEADERVGRDIGDVLALSKMLEGKHVLVEVVDGEVYLHGTVTDQTVKSQVELLSSSVPGAKRIHNELDVRG